MNIAIIYHDADFDGKLSNEVCRSWLKKLHPDAQVHSYGWDYGRPLPSVLPEYPPGSGCGSWSFYDSIYIVDLSVDELMARPELRDKIVWIDHHKSAIEKWDATPSDADPNPEAFTGYRIDGVAACRLCWQWFSVAVRMENGLLPCNAGLPDAFDYKDRRVVEPELIRLAGEYDVWDHRDPDAKALQFGLRALTDAELTDLVSKQFSNSGSEYDRGMAFIAIRSAVKNGHAIKSYCDRQNDEYSAAYSQTIHWEGLTFCALNIGQRGNSDLLRGGIKPEHQACFAWRWTGDAVLVSLYHIEGHTDLDLSVIATKYGGGGHRGACGFRTTLTELAGILALK